MSCHVLQQEACCLDFTLKGLVALERLEKYQDRIEFLKGLSGIRGNEWGMGGKSRGKGARKESSRDLIRTWARCEAVHRGVSYSGAMWPGPSSYDTKRKAFLSNR